MLAINQWAHAGDFPISSVCLTDHVASFYIGAIKHQCGCSEAPCPDLDIKDSLNPLKSFKKNVNIILFH